MQGKTKMWDTLIAKIKGNKKLEIAIYVALGLAAVLIYVCLLYTSTLPTTERV